MTLIKQMEGLAKIRMIAGGFWLLVAGALFTLCIGIDSTVYPRSFLSSVFGCFATAYLSVRCFMESYRAVGRIRYLMQSGSQESAA